MNLKYHLVKRGREELSASPTRECFCNLQIENLIQTLMLFLIDVNAYDALLNCKDLLTAEELAEKMHEELYGGGTSDETTSSSEVR